MAAPGEFSADSQQIVNLLSEKQTDSVQYSEATWLYIQDVNNQQYSNYIQFITTTLKTQFIDYRNAYIEIPMIIEIQNPVAPTQDVSGTAADGFLTEANRLYGASVPAMQRPPYITFKQSVYDLIGNFTNTTDQGLAFTNEINTQMINSLRMIIENDRVWEQQTGPNICFGFNDSKGYLSNSLAPNNGIGSSGSSPAYQVSPGFEAPLGQNVSNAYGMPVNNNPYQSTHSGSESTQGSAGLLVPMAGAVVTGSSTAAPVVFATNSAGVVTIDSFGYGGPIRIGSTASPMNQAQSNGITGSGAVNNFIYLQNDDGSISSVNYTLTMPSLTQTGATSITQTTSTNNGFYTAATGTSAAIVAASATAGGGFGGNGVVTGLTVGSISIQVYADLAKNGPWTATPQAAGTNNGGLFYVGAVEANTSGQSGFSSLSNTGIWIWVQPAALVAATTTTAGTNTIASLVGIGNNFVCTSTQLDALKNNKNVVNGGPCNQTGLSYAQVAASAIIIQPGPTIFNYTFASNFSDLRGPINPTYSPGFFKRVIDFQNSSLYQYIAPGGGTIPSNRNNPTGTHIYRYVAKLYLAGLHDFWNQLDMPIINLGFNITLYLNQQNGANQNPQFPPLMSSNNVGLTTFPSDFTGVPVILYGQGSQQGCRLYYRSIKFSPSDNARVASLLANGFTRSFKFISTDWIQAANNPQQAGNQLAQIMIEQSVVHPLRVWVMSFATSNLASITAVNDSFGNPVPKFDQLASQNISTGSLPGYWEQSNILVNQLNYYRQNFQNPQEAWEIVKEQFTGVNGSMLDWITWLNTYRVLVYDITRLADRLTSPTEPVSLQWLANRGDNLPIGLNLYFLVERYNQVTMKMSSSDVAIVVGNLD